MFRNTQRLLQSVYRNRYKYASTLGLLGSIGLIANAQRKSECAVAPTSSDLLTFPLAHITVPGTKPPVPTLTSTLSPSEQCYYMEDICAYGLPSIDNVVVRQPYVASINFRTRCPNWVAEHYTYESTVDIPKDAKLTRKGLTFRHDPAVPKPFRSPPGDYTNTGYSRGHLAAAASHNTNELSLHETFYTSNIIPQNNVMNEGDWAKLERLTRTLPKYYNHVRCITGPLYLPKHNENGQLVMNYEILGKSRIHVPTHLFKIVYLEGPRGCLPKDLQGLMKKFHRFPVPAVTPCSVHHYERRTCNTQVTGSSQVQVLAFVMPNSPDCTGHELESYLLPLDAVERASGLCLVPRTDPKAITMSTVTRD